MGDRREVRLILSKHTAKVLQRSTKQGRAWWSNLLCAAYLAPMLLFVKISEKQKPPRPPTRTHTLHSKHQSCIQTYCVADYQSAAWRRRDRHRSVVCLASKSLKTNWYGDVTSRFTHQHQLANVVTHGSASSMIQTACAVPLRRWYILLTLELGMHFSFRFGLWRPVGVSPWRYIVAGDSTRSG